MAGDGGSGSLTGDLINRQGEDLHYRAAKMFPGGVNSPVRAFRAVGADPLIIERGEGCYIWDIYGKKYIDFICSWGPLILGHNNPVIRREVVAAAELGLSFGLTNPGEIALGELICAAYPGVDMVRLVSTGTEAAMTSVRLARAFTRRQFIIKFAGCYHGHSDQFLVVAGSGAATFGIPSSAGVPDAVAEHILIADYNNADSVKRLFQMHPKDVAAVIVEPVAANMGVIPPRDGFLSDIRKLCTEYGALLIFDEVISGFRLAKGGAAELFGITPDLAIFGKIIGGGLPVGAVAGRREIMELLAPLGQVYQAGTLSGNPVAIAAGMAMLSQLSEEIYSNIDLSVKMLVDGFRECADRAQVPVQLNRVRSLFSLFFTSDPVYDYNSACSADHNRYARFFRGMLERGILPPPSGFEAWFVSSAHSENEIAYTLDSAKEVLASLGR